MVLVCMILGICLVGTNICLIRYNRQIHKLAMQIKFHRENSSNVSYNLDVHSKEFEELCDELELYNKNARHNLLRLEQHEEQIKAQITDISHDIRTPLTSISGYVQMLQMTDDEEKRRRYFNIIQDRLKTLSTMLDDFFVYSKLNSGTRQGEADLVDVKKVLSQVLLNYYDAFVENEIDVEVQLAEGNTLIFALQENIERLFLNLIKNVLVHGKRTCKISLECALEGVEVSILNETDEDLPKELDKVFDRCYRGDVARSNQESTGLGLAIAKGLVENNGGTITCQIPKEGMFGISVFFPIMKV